MARFVTELLETRSSFLADVEPVGPGGEPRLLVRFDLTGTMQLYELTPGSEPVAKSALPDPVSEARYVPGRRAAVVALDRGGDERHQLYLLDLERDAPCRARGELTALTADDRFVHRLAGISPDGTTVAFVSNRRNGVDFDLWLADLAGGGDRLLYAGGGWCQPAGGFSPDGRTVALARPGARPLDADLLLVDVETGAVALPLPHPDEAAEVGAPAWVGAGRFFVAHNIGRDFTAVAGATAAGAEAVLGGTGEDADADVVASADGSTLVVLENRNGTDRLSWRDAAGTVLGEVPLPEAGVVRSHVIAPPRLAADGSRLYFTLSSPRLAGDVFVHVRGAESVERLTTSPAPLPAEALALPEAATITSFDGEGLPLHCYRPAGHGGPPPVVVLIHGGPESQSLLSFNPVIQGLVGAGYAVVVPNVRGSTGYGKRYAGLDDTTRRLDAVADLAAVHAYLAPAGLDASRAALWGGSYGGYMVLAGLAFQPELWAAGVDIVGISDLVTFLENTSDYRRAHREREYGSLSSDRAFLEAASPLRRVGEIRAPLFVIHGRNDPRVPVGEAEQIAASLRARGVACELVIYEDEGHGLARLHNRLDAYPRAAAFLDEVLRGA